MAIRDGVEFINEDSTMIQQSEGHWQKYLMLVIAKLAPDGVTITTEDMEKFFAMEKVLLTHGHVTSISFKLVSQQEAEHIAEYEKNRKGTA